jgi:hypothetical protein
MTSAALKAQPNIPTRVRETCELQFISALSEELRGERVAKLQRISLSDFFSIRDAILQAQAIS